MTDKETIEQVLPQIARWYAAIRRPLPWRSSPTPYQVWISEIMLQQTRIEAVLPYYRRFLQAFPDIASLASADEDRLLKLWEGLGYYSRAKNLKKAAVMVMENHGGQLPASVAELKKLPGIGEYTAGAVASIAFGLPEPAVDGNVLRVAARLLADDRDVLDPAVRRSVASLLRESYPAGPDAALVTEGLMELGETLCLPHGVPHCGDCPVRDLCRARISGLVEKLPVRGTLRIRRVEQRTVLLLRCGEKTALRRRSSKGLLAGMWEFPSWEGTLSVKDVLSLFPEALAVTPCGKSRHVFTHVEWQMAGYFVELPYPSDGFLWAGSEEIRQQFAVPSAFRAFLNLL